MNKGQQLFIVQKIVTANIYLVYYNNLNTHFNSSSCSPIIYEQYATQLLHLMHVMN